MPETGIKAPSFELPFTMLSDPELKAIQEGIIIRALGKVKAADNPAQMLELI